MADVRGPVLFRPAAISALIASKLVDGIHFGVGGTVVFGVDGIHIGAEGIQSEFAGNICGEFASLCNPPFSTLNGLNSDFSSCYFWNS